MSSPDDIIHVHYSTLSKDLSLTTAAINSLPLPQGCSCLTLRYFVLTASPH